MTPEPGLNSSSKFASEPINVTINNESLRGPAEATEREEAKETNDKEVNDKEVNDKVIIDDNEEQA